MNDAHNICFEKARELGGLILSSEPGLRLSDAEAAFKENSATAGDISEAGRVLGELTEQVMDIIRSTVYGTVDFENKKCCGRDKCQHTRQ